MPSTLFKKRLWHKCFSISFLNFLRTSFFIEHLQWLFLNITYLILSGSLYSESHESSYGQIILFNITIETWIVSLTNFTVNNIIMLTLKIFLFLLFITLIHALKSKYYNIRESLRGNCKFSQYIKSLSVIKNRYIKSTNYP